jgi:outer membrane protein TolC
MYSFIWIALLLWGPARQEPMTLQQIEAAALANNADLRSIEQQAGVTRTRESTTLGIQNPEFMYRGWGAPLLEPWNLNQAQHMFMFTQKIPSRGTRELQYLIATDQTAIDELNVEARKREVLAAARRAFYQLLRSYDQVRLHHEQTALAEQAVEAVRIKYTIGKVPLQDVLKAQIAHSRLMDHLLMFEREADLARAELNTLIGRAPDEPLDVAGEYRILERLPSHQELLDLAVRNRPELQALAVMKTQGGRKLQLAEKAYSPEYTVSAGYMLMPGGSMNRNGWMGELSISLPWLNRGTNDAEIREAQAELAAIDAEYRKAVAAISLEIRQALIQIESARKAVELYRDTLRPQAVMTLRATVAAYQTDQTDFGNLIDSQSMSIDFQHSFFSALETYEKSLADLERAMGGSL